ncbi:MAG: hypothetical protein ABSE49_31400 [Polyangiaceae bacterium]
MQGSRPLADRREGVLRDPRILLAIAAALSAGCGGGLPLLHPARTLPIGEVRAFGGFSGNVPVGSMASALRNAESDPSQGTAPQGQDPTYTKGALVAASVGPGLAPIGGARVGIGWQSEGGLAYTGRALRADLRHAIDLSTHWTLSLGVGGSAALYGHQEGSSLENVSLGQLHGWGADVPLLVGYESDGGLYMLWLGARGGGEHVDISDVTSEPKAVTLGSPPISLSATRFWGGGLLGFAVGFRHLHVAFELDVAYETISGSYNETPATVAGLTVAPATALWWQF